MDSFVSRSSEAMVGFTQDKFEDVTDKPCEAEIDNIENFASHDENQVYKSKSQSQLSHEDFRQDAKGVGEKNHVSLHLIISFQCMSSTTVRL